MFALKPRDQIVLKLPNILSLSRIAFLFIIAALLFTPIRGAVTIALVLFIIAALTDWADGYVARKYNLITDFGKLIDALADKVLVVGMFVCLLTVDGLLPSWSIFLVLLIMGREFLITGLRLVAASKGTVLAAEKGGKIKTVFQIVAVCLLLLSEAMNADFNASASLCKWLNWAGLGTFMVATLLTVQSGYIYMVKYWFLFQEDSSAHQKTK